MSTGPMAGIRIIDLSVMISGPLATMMLADQGAEVIKVETPAIGDLMRYLGSQRGGMTGIFANNNRGKKAITLDLKIPAGIEILHELVRSADVLVQNFRPGAAARIGIDFDTAHGVNPNLVYVSIAGFGQTGPYSNRRVYDNIIQAYSGFAAVQANPGDQRPVLLRNLACDKITAYAAAQAITAALFARATGKSSGQHIELAMLDAAIAFLWPDAAMDAALLADDTVRTPTIGSGYAVVEMANGFTANAFVSNTEFTAWCIAIGRPEVAHDSRFATIAARSANGRELAPLIREVMGQLDIGDYLAAAEREGVPAAPILGLVDLPADPQIQHNQIFTITEHPIAGPLREPRPAPQFSHTPAIVAGPAPMLGEHNDDIARSLGHDPDVLRRRGVFG